MLKAQTTPWRDLLTSAALQQKTKKRPQKVGVLQRYQAAALAVTFVPEVLAFAPNQAPGRGRGVPGMGSTVPQDQAGWPCAAQC